MTKISEKVFDLLIENDANRRKGEISSKTGRDYEDKASFYILTRFNKILKIKNKVTKISFNGLEDLDIFDENERIFSFQIKKRKHTWTKKDLDLLNFLENCINKFKTIKKLDVPVEIRFYFFTNITGNFLEEWNRLHKDKPDDLQKKLPAKIKTILKSHDFTKNEIKIILSHIYFFTGRITTFLDPYIDENLFKKFKEFKNDFEPGEKIDFVKFNEEIFHEKRLMNAKVYEPAYEKDLLISNILGVEIPQKNLYVADKKGKLLDSEIKEYLRESKQRISYLFKYGKIYCFHNFDERNPLTQFIDNNAQIDITDLKNLDENDRIRLLNDWLYNYLNYLGLRYYRRKNKRYFYFCSEGEDKYINWYNPKTRKIREWSVVTRIENFYKNLAAEIKFRTFEGRFFIIIKPRLFFSMNGMTLLRADKIRNIERKFRKSFMKNDFLRRRLYVFNSFIRGDIKEKKQQRIIEFLEKKGVDETITENWKFYDKDLVMFKELIQLEANFKPNIEASKIPSDQEIIGG